MKPDIDLEQGRRFIVLRQLRFPGLSRAKIGEILGGYTESAVRSWERGVGLPNTVLRILADMGVSLPWLLSGLDAKDTPGLSGMVELAREAIEAPPAAKAIKSKKVRRVLKTPTGMAGVKGDVTTLFSTLAAGHRALADLASAVSNGEMDPDIAHRAVLEALNKVAEAHDTQETAGKHSYNSADKNDTGTA